MLLPASVSMISELPLHNPALRSRPSLSLLRYRFRLFFASSSSAACSAVRRDPGSGDFPLEDNGHDEIARSGADRRRSGDLLRSSPASAPWLQHWTPRSHPVDESAPEQVHAEEESRIAHSPSHAGGGDGGGGISSIESIVRRLRSLGSGTADEADKEVIVPEQRRPLNGDERLEDLLERSWNRPGTPIVEESPEGGLLPWERKKGGDCRPPAHGEGSTVRKERRVKAPTLAELTIEDAELRRLRRMGAALRVRTTVPKAGLTQAVLEKIHDVWHFSELVRLRFHESLARDMKMAHELVERRTGGLVIWRAGSSMVVYRGMNYKIPPRLLSDDVGTDSAAVERGEDVFFVPGITPLARATGIPKNTVYKMAPTSVTFEPSENMTEEEAEFNSTLDGIGPRFVDWWGTGILPVDADLLPQHIPDYKPPFRLLPTGMRSHLTNSELTNVRKLSKKMPCHFALGRNRNHHGLAEAILKLWEKNLVVKIAVKRGLQNTNSKLMAEELKKLTGGTLLLRNKFYIVIYRGKDFLPTAVATVLAERDKLVKEARDVEDRARNSRPMDPSKKIDQGYALVGTLAEFQEAKARWGVNITSDEREMMREEASKIKATRLLKRIEHKRSIAEIKKHRAERLLAKVEESMVPVRPSDDQEILTDEERSVYRRIGLRMKTYLPLGIRGVFAGVIENMHLHWKYREVVKLISKQKTFSFVADTARLLENESGGILVSIDKTPKTFILIYYRGRNYRRPFNLRPRNLMTKAKALERFIAMQRREAHSQRVAELERTIDQMKSEMAENGDPSVLENGDDGGDNDHVDDNEDL